MKNFNAHEDSVRKLFRSKVTVKTFNELKAVHGEEHVEGATIFNNRDQSETRLDLDEILLNIGFLANLGPIREWGLAIEGNAIRVNERMETSLPGVFAAGDIATHPGKIKLIATGASEAAVAVNNARNHLEPSSRVQSPNTTTMKTPPGKDASPKVHAPVKAKE